MQKRIQYAASQVTWPPAMNLSVYKWRYRAHKLIPSFPHLIISLLILPTNWNHTTRENQYLRARLDTCANVNIMPASIYKLVFQDPGCKKLAPSKLEIGTYTTDTVKLVGSCMFYLVQTDSKCPLEVTFYMASNNGSVLLSCVTTLALGLIQPRSRLDYLLPRASLLTSSADHPIKTRSQINVHVSKKESEVYNHKGMVSKLITSKEQILVTYADVLMVLDAFLVPHTILRWILVSHLSKPPADQSLFIWKKLSRRRLTRCYKQEFWSLWTKQLPGSTVLY